MYLTSIENGHTDHHYMVNTSLLSKWQGTKCQDLEERQKQKARRAWNKKFQSLWGNTQALWQQYQLLPTMISSSGSVPHSEWCACAGCQIFWLSTLWEWEGCLTGKKMLQSYSGFILHRLEIKEHGFDAEHNSACLLWTQILLGVLKIKYGYSASYIKKLGNTEK